MANTVGTSLLRFLGLTGSTGAPTGSLVPRPNTPDSDQKLFNDFRGAGEIGNPDVWGKFNSYTRKPTTFDGMLTLWEEMSAWDLMAAALKEIVDEATQLDQYSPATLWYECNDKDFEEELNGMLINCNVEENLPSQVWGIAGLGNHFEKLEYEPEVGVVGMSYINPMEIRRYWLERNRRCIGFRWMKHRPDKEPAFVRPDNQTPVERVALASNNGQLEDLWYPWDILHFRRLYRLRISEHGEPIFSDADGIYKKIRLAIDQMVVHRAQVQPDRYAINVDVKDQPPTEQMKTIQRWKQSLRSKLAFGGEGGSGNAGFNDPSQFSSFYNAWSLDTIMWVAKPTNFQHVIEKLAGTANVPDVYDIELLLDLFYSIIGMPRSWFGGQKEGGEAPASGKALLAQDMRFLRQIKSIRRPLISQYTWLGYFHALLRGQDVKKLNIKACMPPIGGLEDQMKMELLGQQVEVLSGLADVMEKCGLPKEAWVELLFKKYMHLPDNVVNAFITALPASVEASPMESKQSSPTVSKIIGEIDKKVNSTPLLKEKLQLLKEAINGDLRKPSFEKHVTRNYESMFSPPEIKDFDLVVSSYGQSPFQLKNRESKDSVDKNGSKSSVPKVIMENAQKSLEGPLKPTETTKTTEPAYRQWMPDKF